MAKRSVNGRGRPKKQTEALHRMFGDLEVVDAKNDLRVPITPADAQGATKKDPTNCPIARGCKRELGSSAVAIFKTRAYVDVLGEDGVRRVERFRLGTAAQALVRAFDKGAEVPTDGRWLVLSAPAPSQTLDADLKVQRRRRAAIAKGEITEGPPKGEGPKGNAREVEVRSGTGLWHMARTA